MSNIIGDTILALLFISFVAWLFVTLFCEALEAQGRHVPRWFRAILIILVVIAFMSVIFAPGDAVKDFQAIGSGGGVMECYPYVWAGVVVSKLVHDARWRRYKHHNVYLYRWRRQRRRYHI